MSDESLGTGDFARRSGSAVELRPDPMRASIRCAPVHSADGHDVQVSFECSIGSADTAADRRMLAEVLLSAKSSVSIEDISEYLASTIQSRIAEHISKHEATMLLSQEGRYAIMVLGEKALDATAFSCGLQILPPMGAEVRSASLERSRIEAAHRKRAEESATGHVQHIRKAAELMREFEELRRAAPHLTAGAAMGKLAPADRGAVFESLMLASAQQGEKRSIWLVAGGSLVQVDPRSSPPVSTTIALPTDLGPLRSVQTARIEGRDHLLVGARDGIMLLDPAAPASPKRYQDEGKIWRMGFNSCVYDGQLLRGSHSEAGIVSWILESADAAKSNLIVARVATSPRSAEQPSRESSIMVSTASGGTELIGPRNLNLTRSGTILFSVAGELFRIVDEKAEPLFACDHTIVAIIDDVDRVFVVDESGMVRSFDAETWVLATSERRSDKLVAACALPWMDAIRLLLAPRDGPIVCVGPDDQLVTQYVSNHRGCKMIAACADVVAAVSSDRQRLILWNSWDGRQPIAEINIAALARHRIADVTFA